MRRVGPGEASAQPTINGFITDPPNVHLPINIVTRRVNFRSVRTVLVLTLSTYSWLPGQVGFTQLGFPNWLFMVCNFAYVCSTWWNGATYAITNKDFRKAAKKMVKCVTSEAISLNFPLRFRSQIMLSHFILVSMKFLWIGDTLWV